MPRANGLVYDTAPFEPRCFAQHIGLWMIEPRWFSAAVAAVRAGSFEAPIQDQNVDMPLYMIDGDGIATIELNGPLMKGDSKFGGTSMVRSRRAIRRASNDDDVRAIMLSVDSPGGTVAGTAELAADVKAATGVKRVHAHIEDLGASAAYWIASQADRITATATSEIGSIGTLAVIEDSSGKAEAEGIKVHVVSTGEFKGSFVDGAPISEGDLAYLQERIDNLNGHFLSAIASGRNMPPKQVRELADGRVWLAAESKKRGLIDGVGSVDAARDRLLQVAKSRPARTRAALKIAEAELG